MSDPVHWRTTICWVSCLSISQQSSVSLFFYITPFCKTKNMATARVCIGKLNCQCSLQKDWKWNMFCFPFEPATKLQPGLGHSLSWPILKYPQNNANKPLRVLSRKHIHFTSSGVSLQRGNESVSLFISASLFSCSK